ncbi:nicotinate phosphoribosyltransferase [Anaerococcus sp. NML200574]|uniref:nicotinate phosphoribosyltransferase n=1 Tax=Anaerococcus sp. NML200574 TaxID=2954486 RepID=UPI002236F156|nr:nicotinate phosphoribosyltransferase [Anaerococcus sp. NML200574]MCW6679123.1 nicotinate phosphoribosyltransferase [Anaerococcus sp. NML200574]
MSEIRNLSMLSDFYEFTMAAGYFENGMKDQVAVFDAFYRKNPDGGGYAIFAGLNDVIDFIKNLHFTEDDIEYFRQTENFSEEFLEYLSNFKFTGDVWAFPEGSVMFPGEPIITVKAPIIECSIIETYLLLSMNFNSLIATKTNRIVSSARGRLVMEFGARRAQGADASITGARAAFISGAPLTSNTYSSQKYGFKAAGTMAHSWIQAFDSEYEAFKTYAKMYPDNCILLIDTYDTLESGLVNAMKVFKEELVPKGLKGGVRIDSGDLAYLSKEVRKRLDENGLEDFTIVASNSLDEFKIESLLAQGAQIDSFGIGERLITAKSDPVFGGVYKLVAMEKDGDMKAKIKVSENVEKITTPGFKKVYRLYDKKTGKAEADYIALAEEKVDDSKPMVIFDPLFTWKMKKMKDFRAREMQVQIFDKGELVYEQPCLEEIAEYRKEEVASLWDEVKRYDSPHNYYVDLSQDLWNLKQKLILEAKSK